MGTYEKACIDQSYYFRSNTFSCCYNNTLANQPNTSSHHNRVFFHQSLILKYNDIVMA